MNYPLYLIPGTMCDGRLWHKLTPYLSTYEIHHAVYAGQTSMDDMLAAVVENKPEKSHLISFSLGGYLAMEAALKNPDNFERIIIIASSPYGLSDDEKQLRRVNAKMLSRMTYRGMSRKRLSQFVSPNNMTDNSVTNTILQMEKDLGQDELINQLIAPIDRRNLKEDLITIGKPIHFIMAEEDELVPIGAIEKLAEAYEHIHLHRMEGSGHMIPLEIPEKLAEIINYVIKSDR
ncbi:alpha/beta fold hydrolase [Kordiimonas laminariae]|uniref:alpha/beta fold hydrolase n=1 Tax=Kordiimonas laminariae TaxID=2917717 RepID=UPI001FF2572E|nr:alpha/beta hydrolase [Kordiimonas laminariae]MCK0070139.1 alpha/beta hydrolase [Kordiimonas laminariae]